MLGAGACTRDPPAALRWRFPLREVVRQDGSDGAGLSAGVPRLPEGAHRPSPLPGSAVRPGTSGARSGRADVARCGRVAGTCPFVGVPRNVTSCPRLCLTFRLSISYPFVKRRRGVAALHRRAAYVHLSPEDARRRVGVEVVGGPAQQRWVIASSGEQSAVAPPAQEAAHDTASVVVVDGQALPAGAVADRAPTLLSRDKGVVLAGAQAVNSLHACRVTRLATRLALARGTDTPPLTGEEPFSPVALTPRAAAVSLPCHRRPPRRRRGTHRR